MGKQRVERESESPADSGRRWAEERADRLSEIPAVDWPDLWETRMDGPLELPEEVTAVDAPVYRQAAHHAAVERWLELVEEQRQAESFEEEEADAETAAVKLLEALSHDLPEEWTVDRDGPRVYLQDRYGIENTVHSLEDAWRVLSEWDERLSR